MMTLLRRLWSRWYGPPDNGPSTSELPASCTSCLDDYGVLLRPRLTHAPLCARARRDIERALANGEKVRP